MILLLLNLTKNVYQSLLINMNSLPILGINNLHNRHDLNVHIDLSPKYTNDHNGKLQQNGNHHKQYQ